MPILAKNGPNWTPNLAKYGFKKAENPIPETTDDKFLIEIKFDGNEKELKKLIHKTDVLEVKVHINKKSNHE